MNKNKTILIIIALSTSLWVGIGKCIVDRQGYILFKPNGKIRLNASTYIMEIKVNECLGEKIIAYSFNDSLFSMTKGYHYMKCKIGYLTFGDYKIIPLGKFSLNEEIILLCPYLIYVFFALKWSSRNEVP